MDWPVAAVLIAAITGGTLVILACAFVAIVREKEDGKK
jgi:hypothetical protein